MNEKLEKMRNGKGFIAALDQSGGSTPKALKLYGINENEYSNDKEMFSKQHQDNEKISSFSRFHRSSGLKQLLRLPGGGTEEHTHHQGFLQERGTGTAGRGNGCTPTFSTA